MALPPDRTIASRGLHVTNLAALADALAAVACNDCLCLIDGFAVPDFGYPHRPIVDGDATSAAIAAASIIAKGTRDRFMQALREIRGNQPPLVERSSVTPEYFHLLGIPLLRGRLFSDQDNENVPQVAIINEAFARTWWPSDNPVGKRVKLNGLSAATSWTTVVGVVADARTESLEEADVPQIYNCLFQTTDDELVLFLRGRLDPAATPEEVRLQVHSINPELPVFGAMTLPGVVSGSL